MCAKSGQDTCRFEKVMIEISFILFSFYFFQRKKGGALCRNMPHVASFEREKWRTLSYIFLFLSKQNSIHFMENAVPPKKNHLICGGPK